MITIVFYNNIPVNIPLRFVVIVSRYNGKWVYVRHKKRSTYEVPGGHIEDGEDFTAAARRELYEETGAIDFTMQYVCVYTVANNNSTDGGYLFYADINTLSLLPDYEMEELVFFDDLPDNLTYPEIQPQLLNRVQLWLKNTKQCLTLLYGTSNKGKLDYMRACLAPLGIKIIGLNDITVNLPEIDESGNDPLENAKIKALAYYKALKTPVFSCDSGLFIKEVPDELQPGVHVRNINGKHLNDEEMLDYYSRLATILGGNMTARYQNGICLVLDDNEIYEYMGDDIAGEEFIITSKPHPRRTAGFPIDSLSVHIKTGQYYYDMSELKDRSSMDGGFQNFFRRVLNIN